MHGLSKSLGRFSLRERIGHGSMGLVFRAMDDENGHEVALKALRLVSPEDLYRLKREFRTLSRISHPNLVRLYDLVVTEETCFFTMELVDGVELTQYLRWDGTREGGFLRSFDRVRDSLRQLVSALDSLHSVGKLHRDIKPGNVLVEPGGRLVLLDFGLVGGVWSDRSLESQSGALVGTLAYMAPEQLRGETLTPASDWYSVGVMLFEAMAGRLPFDERSFLMARAREVPRLPWPNATTPIPEDLDAIVSGLLHSDPKQRPTSQWILSTLKASASHAIVPPVPAGADPASPFVGREAELRKLREVFQRSRRDCQTIAISGQSGIGKTALVDRFCACAEHEYGALILKGRCHPQESVPFKTMDALVDELARVLSRRSTEYLQQVMPRNAAALARVFPVLRRVREFEHAAAHGVAGAEPQEVLQRAAEAFRDLIARMAEKSPVMLWVDDLQWGDLDSVDFVRALQRPPHSPRVLLILSYRVDPHEASRLLPTFLEREPGGAPEAAMAAIELLPLDRQEASTLAARILEQTGSPSPDALLDTIARDSGGSPFFAVELARHAAAADRTGADFDLPRLAELLLVRVNRLPDEARRLLEVVCVAERPVEKDHASRAAGLVDPAEAMHLLRSERMVRVASTDGSHRLTTYHDRIRDAVLDALTGEARARVHLDLAEAMESRPDADPQLLLEHYLRAEARERAAEYALRAARKAAQALAFNRAASLYRRAIGLGAGAAPEWCMRAELAASLANAGLGVSAAAAYLEAADLLEGEGGDRFEVLRLRRSAAEYYLRSGFLDEGIDVVRRVLAELGLRYRTRFLTALLSLIFNRWRFAMERAIRPTGKPGPVSATTRARMDALWSAGLGLSDFDAVRAFDFQIRHALLALRAGDAAHLARALSTQAVILAMEGGPRKHERAASAQVEGERYAVASGDLQAQAHSMLMSAGVTFFERRYRDALAKCQRGEAFCRDQCVGAAWELANLEFLAVYSLAYLGELRTLQQRLPEMLRRAHERTDHFALTYYRMGLLVLTWLAPDRPDEARAQLEAALAQFSPATSPWQYHMGVYGAVHIDLYEGRSHEARIRTREAWRLLRAKQMLRLETVRVEQRVARARALIACVVEEVERAGRAGSPTSRRFLSAAEALARRVAREDSRWAAPFADALIAGIASVREDTEEAIRRLDRAAVGFDGLGMAIHAATSRYQRAHLGIDAGHDVDSATELLRTMGVARPNRFAFMLVPGRWPASAAAPP